MKRSIILLSFLLLGIHIFAPCQLSAQSDETIPLTFRNNNFYTESLRQANLAKLSYDAGDFDASIFHSEEAIRFANLSDEYVAKRLKMWEADKAILAASRRLEYASTINAASRFPAEYSRAQAAFREARSFRAMESWDEAIEAANRVLSILAYIDAGRGGTAGTGSTGAKGGTPVLPAQYTVRTWEDFKDCLWNIAGRPWVYDDPEQWLLLYSANRAKFPEKNNPNLVHPGTVLDIPSLRGEFRQGMWDADER
jgi:tetratricopeptide (TPR) repeat protein